MGKMMKAQECTYKYIGIYFCMYVYVCKGERERDVTL